MTDKDRIIVLMQENASQRKEIKNLVEVLFELNQEVERLQKLTDSLRAEYRRDAHGFGMAPASGPMPKEATA